MDTGLNREEAAERKHLAFIAEVSETDQSAAPGPGPAPLSAAAPDDGLVPVHEMLLGLTYTRGLLRRYDFGQMIGKGHFAQVLTCTNKITGLQYAAKVISARPIRASSQLYGMSNEDLQSIRLEIKSLRELTHPNIIGLIDVVVTDEMDRICLIMELSQVQFFNYIVEKTKLSETETRRVFKQLLGVISFMVGAHCHYSAQ